MIPFFITGLPRSRTAWLANFCTHGGILCGHDLLCGRTTQQFLRDMEYVHGSAETALYAPHYADDLLPVVKQARLVVVHRKPKEVVASLERLGIEGADGLVEIAGQWLEDFESEVSNRLVVDFRALDEAKVLDRIWDYVTDGKEPAQPRERIRLLRQLNVQVTPERWAEFFESAHAHAGRS